MGLRTGRLVLAWGEHGGGEAGEFYSSGATRCANLRAIPSVGRALNSKEVSIHLKYCLYSSAQSLLPSPMAPSHQPANGSPPKDDAAARLSDAAMRKKKNADAQAAFRARRANYIATLEETGTYRRHVIDFVRIAQPYARF